MNDSMVSDILSTEVSLLSPEVEVFIHSLSLYSKTNIEHFAQPYLGSTVKTFRHKHLVG